MADLTWQGMEAERIVLSKRNYRKVRPTLSRIHTIVTDRLRELTIPELEPFIRYELPNLALPQWNALYSNLYRNTANTTASATFARLSGQKEFGNFMTPIQAYTQNLDKRIALVNNTTVNKYLKELGLAVEITNDIRQIAQILDTTVNGAYNRLRAMQISRTETTTAHNLGRQAGALALNNLTIIKTWVTMQDATVRDAHAIANGQQKLITQPFVVDGETMMFPCDFTGTATAHNLVNCRCGEAYTIT